MVDDPRWRDDPSLDPSIGRAAAAALAAAGVDAAARPALSVLLADDATLKSLNGQFRGRPTATNVLSFPSAQRAEPIWGETARVDDFLGDVAISYDRVSDEARDEGKTLEHHVAHLIVHGVLHLLGFDHGTDAEAERMERVERDALATLGVADPYAMRTVEDSGPGGATAD